MNDYEAAREDAEDAKVHPAIGAFGLSVEAFEVPTLLQRAFDGPTINPYHRRRS